MRGYAAYLALALLAGCGRPDAAAPEADVQRGIDRSVADVRAAQAAASGPVAPSLSAAELAAKSTPAKAAAEDG